MKKIAFLVEPSSQLYNLENENIFLVDSNLIVYYDNDKEESINTSSINNNYYKILKNSTKILTSIPAVGKIYETIEKLLTEYDLVIGLPISKYLSNAYSAWKSLEGDFNNKFHVVDVNEIEIGIKWTIEYIQENINNFKNINELQILLNKRKANIINFIVLTNVEKLVASGRVSKFNSKLVDLLKFKIILNLSEKDKTLTLCKKVLSMESATNFFINQIKSNSKYKGPKSIKHIALLSSYEQSSVLDEIINDLNKEFHVPISINKISPIVAAHTGINAFGIYVEIH